MADAGVTFRVMEGTAITPTDWAFFYHCYERTYLEHGNPPYFNRAFFSRMASDMPEDWVLFIAEREGQPIAASLLAINASSMRASGQNDADVSATSNPAERVAYGRYWGALERVDCLHFACLLLPAAAVVH